MRICRDEASSIRVPDYNVCIQTFSDIAFLIVNIEDLSTVCRRDFDEFVRALAYRYERRGARVRTCGPRHRSYRSESAGKSSFPISFCGVQKQQWSVAVVCNIPACSRAKGLLDALMVGKGAHDVVCCMSPVFISIHTIINDEVLCEDLAENALSFQTSTRQGFKCIDARCVHQVQRGHRVPQRYEWLGWQLRLLPLAVETEDDLRTRNSFVINFLLEPINQFAVFCMNCT